MTRIEKWTHNSFQNEIVKFARLNGWKCQYWWKSYHSPKGYLDLVLVRYPRHIKAELKIPPDKVSPEQQEWIDVWKQFKDIEVYVWTPDQWDEIIRILSRK